MGPGLKAARDPLLSAVTLRAVPSDEAGLHPGAPVLRPRAHRLPGRPPADAHHRCRDVSGFVYLISDDPVQIVTDYRRLRQVEETQLYAVRSTDSTPSPAQPGRRRAQAEPAEPVQVEASIR
jgi:hypothetical protein